MKQIYIYPTDTVWGIGCDIYNKMACERVAEIKRTRPDKPVSILVQNLFDLKFTNMSAIDLELFNYEITFLVQKNLVEMDIPDWIHHQSEWLGIRFIPELSETELFSKCKAVVTTSLNFSGEPSIISRNNAQNFYKHIENESIFFDLPRPQPSGLNSTIVKINGDQIEIVRAGHYVKKISSLLGINS